ncbi:MAG: hypothetical protein ACRBFS_27130, partial [Aureispira sp.]
EGPAKLKMVAIGLKKPQTNKFSLGLFRLLAHPPINRAFLHYTGHSIRYRVASHKGILSSPL